MIKLVFCVRRLPHLSLEQFQRYWLETHGPLVRRHAATLRIKRYIQVHTLDSPVNEAMRRSRGAAEPYDGVAELWWDSVQDLAAGTASAEAGTWMGAAAPSFPLLPMNWLNRRSLSGDWQPASVKPTSTNKATAANWVV